MRKIFKFDNNIEIEVEYKKDNLGRDCFSAMGEKWNKKHTAIEFGGQCFGDLKKYLKNDNLFMTIYGLWERNHLNDMVSYANETQRIGVEEYLKTHKEKYDYEKVCEYLKSKGIFEVEVKGKKCKYGYEWYYKPISKDDKKLIKNIMK